MSPGELLLRYQALEQRSHALRQEIDRVVRQLATDPEADRLRAAVAETRERRQAIELRLREADRRAQEQRARLRARDKELMSGRIRNPTELSRMSEEVDHLRTHLAEEEDAELAVMEEQEGVEAEIAALVTELDQASARHQEAIPGLDSRRRVAEEELAATETERDRVWAEVPALYQADFRRLRVQPPVAEVRNGQCTGCHVVVTTSGMQLLRRGDALVHCENCGRLLVAT